MNDPVDFDAYTKNYNELLHDQTSFFSPSEAYFARYKVDIVKQRGGDGVRRILEYGCGIGRNIPFLQAAWPQAEIVGTDISAASLDVARRDNPGARFMLEDDALSDIGQFDIVFVAGVFHHVPPPVRIEVAGKIARRMVPGARLFVFEHNPYNPVTRRIVNTCPYDADAVLLKPSEMRDILRRGGLAVDRREYCLFIPPSLPRLLPLERHLGWLPLGGQYWVQAHLPA